MRILHFSDSHGDLPFAPELANDCDIVICSGDMMPNGKLRADPGWNRQEQPKWVKRNAEWFRALGKPFLFCAGNHDFIDPCEILLDKGINAVNITNRLVMIDGVRVYGFPWIPYIAGEWGWEITHKEMVKKVREIPFDTEILVCHAPLEGMLSDPSYGGNTALASFMFYEWEIWPKAILSGHHHNTAGVREHNGSIISNAATTYHILEVP